jgi:hypothetical protein
MKNGKCPKCGSATVFTLENGVAYGFKEPIVNTGASILSESIVDSYLCTTCGYFENYIKDPHALAQIAAGKKWKAVPTAAQ